MAADIGDRVARRIQCDAPRQLRRVIMGVPDILAPLDDIVRAVIDQSRAARAAARRIVVIERVLIFDLARPSANRHVPAREQRVGVLRAELRVPRKLPRNAVRAIYDLGDLPRSEVRRGGPGMVHPWRSWWD